MENENKIQKDSKKNNKINSVLTNLIQKLVEFSLILLIVLIVVATYKAFLYRGDFSYLNKVENNITLIYIIGVIFLALLFLTLFKLIDKFKLGNKKIIVVLSFLIIIVLQITYASVMKTIPINDPGITHDEAVSIVKDNNISDKIHWNYFQRCTNNIPFTIMLGNIYKVCNLIGITDYVFVRNIICMIFIDITILFGYLFVKGIKNNNTGLKFLLICMFNPLIYIEVSYLYPNTISMTFVMVMIYLFYKIIKAETIKMKVILTILLGLTTVVGGILRPTSYIVLIAFAIYVILKLIQNKKYLKSVLICGAIFIITGIPTMMLYKGIEKSYVKFDYTDTATPWSHYIMMGLGKNGSYSGEDVRFTRSFDTKKEKITANLDEARNRLRELNISGLMNLASSKIQTVWSEGTSKYLLTSIESENYNKLYKYVVGSKNDLVVLYSQIYRITLLVFALISTVLMIKNKKLNFDYIIYLTLLGAMLFFLMWEANKTYAICFIPILMLLATKGITEINEKNMQKIYINNKKIFGVIILITVILLVSNYNHFTKKGKYIDKEILINQTQYSVDYITRLYGDDVVYQTFYADKPFNTIELELKNPRKVKGVNYYVELLNNNNEIIKKFEIPSEEIIDEPKENVGKTIKRQKEIKIAHKTILKFKSIKPDGKEKYTIKIYGDENTTYRKSINIGAYISENFDKVKDAELYRNNENLNGDLQFSVYREQNKAYFSPKVYIALATLMVLLEIVLYFTFNYAFLDKKKIEMLQKNATNQENKQ